MKIIIIDNYKKIIDNLTSTSLREDERSGTQLRCVTAKAVTRPQGDVSFLIYFFLKK